MDLTEALARESIWILDKGLYTRSPIGLQRILHSIFWIPAVISGKLSRQELLADQNTGSSSLYYRLEGLPPFLPLVPGGPDTARRTPASSAAAAPIGSSSASRPRPAKGGRMRVKIPMQKVSTQFSASGDDFVTISQNKHKVGVIPFSLRAACS